MVRARSATPVTPGPLVPGLLALDQREAVVIAARGPEPAAPAGADHDEPAHDEPAHGGPGHDEITSGTSRQRAEPARSRPVARVTVTADGPVLLEGPVEVVLPDGTTALSQRPVTALCTCASSRRYPFCDTSHRRRVRGARPVTTPRADPAPRAPVTGPTHAPDPVTTGRDTGSDPLVTDIDTARETP